MAQPSTKSIPAPKGTRDLYPDDLLRQRYITEAWRRVSIRHGFDEIAGPTFEMLDLYKKKSGEGIVSELFSFRRTGGDDDYALRPEFTPTLARMYAAKANALPSPCKWFTAGPYFRAEKPQRGRLREFLQWNCDVMGGDTDNADFQSVFDAEIICVIVELFSDSGFSPNDVLVRLNSRSILHSLLIHAGVEQSQVDAGVRLLDKWSKIDDVTRARECNAIGLDLNALNRAFQIADSMGSSSSRSGGITLGSLTSTANIDVTQLDRILRLVPKGWAIFDPGIARGLAYYTGTVFELIADGERAVAGGGRYDNLIELFGGPPTPAVGFGMGDVVLGLLLQDKGLMPEGPELMEALSQKPASLRPEAFVIANEAGEAQVEPLLAKLRRGVESEAWNSRADKKPWDADRYCSNSGGVSPMHARRSYKSTKNIGKLLADARKQHAKFAVIIESDEAAKVENLDTREDLGTFPLDGVGAAIAERL
ncbi:MAG: ATP phosphoribosyltransferase regulatory subunit [Phycisphaerales bacterium]|nr:ATP phosphoribosyltransferase regulatory subunit [Phycisphaerales bacterium]MCB9837380.1 ATP phosphoribosyltransferase regulatory subunit [Phycisphaera sp.]